MISLSNSNSTAGLPASLLSGGAPPVNLDFVSTWDTTKAGSASDTVVLPLLSGGVYSGTIDWGDGNSDDLSYANRTHVYASSGIYTITISGSDIQGFLFGNFGDKAKITDVSNWGNLAITTTSSFFGCSNLDISATDAPTLSVSNCLYQMFRSCTSLTTPNFSAWDTSTQTDARLTFYLCTYFNGNVSNWDVGSVTDMTNMFNNASSFNQPLNSWNVSSVTLMDAMFKDCTNFNQPLDNWDVSNVTVMGGGSPAYNGVFNGATSFNQDLSSWNIGNVTNMGCMFYNAIAFNQPIGSWNTSSVTNMQYMFSNADSFDQDISSWDINQVTNFLNFMVLASGLSTANYDALLIAWDAQGAMSYSGTVNFGLSKYTAGGAAEAARTSLISKWGGIIDGGPA